MADSIRLALAVNGTVASVKLAASIVSGSPAMMAEAAHSVVDCTTQALLWVGDVRGATRPAAPFRWGIAAGVFMFASGGVYSIATGVMDLLVPSEHGHTGHLIALIVLGLATVLEAVSLTNALRELLSERPDGVSVRGYLHTAGNTGALTVLAEDAADIVGNLVAAAGVGVTVMFSLGWVDAAASIVVGALLLGLSVFLVKANRRELSALYTECLCGSVACDDCGGPINP